MGKKNGFDRIKEERKSLSFYKIFQSSDLSSESMRALPYNLVRKISEKDFSYKMVIKAEWGSSWEVEIAKNPRFYYMEKLGWNQFVSDNALGENEFVTFTHRGKMRFSVNIYEQHGKEIVKPRKPPSMASTSRRSKKEQAENIHKDVKKEEETCEGIKLDITKKKTEESKNKKIKSKKPVSDVETVGVKARKKQIVRTKVVNGVPEFTLTIKKSYLKFLGMPKDFVENHIPNESKIFTIRHPNGKGPWKALCLVRKARTMFSRGWSKLAREYPLLIGDVVTFKLIKLTEFVVYKKAKEEITP